jgi:hypothetical protein
MVGAVDRRITARRVRGYAVLFLLAWVGSLAGSVVLGRPPLNALGKPILPDFLNHWSGGRLLLDGLAGELYSSRAQVTLQVQVIGPSAELYWFVGPPFAALLFLPFAALPYLPSTLAWTLCSTLLLVLAARLARPLLPELGRREWGALLLVGAASQPTYELIGSGQDSALNLLLWIAGIRLALARRELLAGAVFALGLHKPQLFFLVPLVFLCWGRWRALAGWALTAGLLGGVSLLLVGLDGVRAWLALLASPLYREAVQADQAWKMQSLPALLTALAPRELAGAAESLGLIIGLGLVALFGWQARRLRRAGAEQELTLWAFACLTTLIASPHLGLYDFILVLIPAAVLVARANERAVRLALLAIFALTWTLALRHGFVLNAPWPLTVFGASWTAAPLLVLWSALHRVAERAPGTASSRSERPVLVRGAGLPAASRV